MSTELKIEVREEPAWKRVIDIEVPAERLAQEYDKACSTFQKKAKVPGFRPGKVPKAIIEQRFGAEVQREALEQTIADTLQQAYQTHKLRPITDPAVSNIEAKTGEPLKYRATIEVRPTVAPTGYDGLTIQKQTRPVTSESYW